MSRVLTEAVPQMQKPLTPQHSLPTSEINVTGEATALAAFDGLESWHLTPGIRAQLHLK